MVNKKLGPSLQVLLAYTAHNVQHVVTYTDRKVKRGSNVLQPEKVINSEDNEHPELKERNKKRRPSPIMATLEKLCQQKEVGSWGREEKRNR